MGAKGATDILVARSVLLVLLPFLVMGGTGVRLNSPGPGPALHISEWVGRNGQPFKMVKFRSMIDGAHLNYEEPRESKNDSVNRVLLKHSE